MAPYSPKVKCPMQSIAVYHCDSLRHVSPLRNNCYYTLHYKSPEFFLSCRKQQADRPTVDEFISVSNGQFRHVCHNKVLLKLGERRMTFQNIEAFHAIFAKLRRSKFTEHFELIEQGSA